jgi:hypothetical protein
MKKITFFEKQVNSRKKISLTKIDSNEFETAKAIYFDYWPPMQLHVALLKFGKKSSESKI